MKPLTPAAVSATTILAVLCVGGLAVAAGRPTPAVRPELGAGVLWLATDSRGALTAVDVATGRPVAEVSAAEGSSGTGAGAQPDRTSRLVTAGNGSRAAVLDVATSTLSVLAPDGTPDGDPVPLAAGQFRPTDITGVADATASLVVVDGPRGAYRTVVGERIAAPRTLPSPITAAVTDSHGVSWLAQAATGQVVGIRGEQVSAPTRVCAGGKSACALTVIDGAAVAVDPASGVVQRLAFAAVDQPPQSTEIATTAASSDLVVGAPGPALVTVDPAANTITVAGQVTSSQQGAEPARDVPLLLPTPVRSVSGVASVADRVVLTDDSAGWVVVTDATSGRTDRIRLHDGPSRLQLIRIDDDVVVNDPDSDQALVISAERTTPVTKFDEAVAAAAIPAGEAPPATTPAPAPPTPSPSATPTAAPTAAAPSAAASAAPGSTATAAPVPTVPVATAPTVPTVPTVPRVSPTPNPGAPPPTPANSAPSHNQPTQNPPAQNPPAQNPPTQNQPTQNPSAQNPVPPAAPGTPSLQLIPDGQTLAARAQLATSGGPVTSLTVRLVDQDNRAVPEVTVPGGTTTARITVERCGNYSGTVTATGPGGTVTSGRVGPVLVCDQLGPVTGLTATALTGTRARLSWTQPPGAEGLDHTVTLTPADASGAPIQVSAGRESTVDVAGLTPLTTYTVTVDVSDRWGRSGQATASTRTLPASVGVCGTLLRSPAGSKYAYPYKSWATCTTGAGGKGPDFRVFTDLSPEQGIDTVLRVYTRTSDVRPGGLDYRLALTTPAGEMLETFGVPTADWTPGAVLGYVATRPVSPVGDKVVAWDGADPVTGADFTWYTDGSVPSFNNGRGLATFRERGRVIGAG